MTLQCERCKVEYHALNGAGISAWRMRQEWIDSGYVPVYQGECTPSYLWLCLRCVEELSKPDLKCAECDEWGWEAIHLKEVQTDRGLEDVCASCREDMHWCGWGDHLTKEQLFPDEAWDGDTICTTCTEGGDGA